MSGPIPNDWDPDTYHWFREFRLQPALDLLARVDQIPDGDVVDLGCGAGDVARALREKFCNVPGVSLIGVDRSPAMLKQAKAPGLYDHLAQVDISDWAPSQPPALIYSNGSLNWTANHDELLPRLVAALAPGGTLAVQVPHQHNAPSHRLWRTLAEEMCPGRLAEVTLPSVLPPAHYFHMLEKMGEMSLWETEYFQKLPASEEGHPVRRFTEATYARPILQSLPDTERQRLISAFDELIPKAYPLSSDGGALFPIRRLFFTVTRA